MMQNCFSWLPNLDDTCRVQLFFKVYIFESSAEALWLGPMGGAWWCLAHKCNTSSLTLQGVPWSV